MLSNRIVHDHLAALLKEQFGWTVEIEDDDLSGLCAVIAVPGSSEHVLRFRSEPNSVEVGYDDALPPGPAERLFVFEPHELEDALAHGVVAFVQELVNEEVLVVRERLFLAGSRSQLRFRRRSELSRRAIARSLAIYSWGRTFDKEHE